MKPYEERPYRPGVGIMLLNGESDVFVGQRIDNPADALQSLRDLDIVDGRVDRRKSAQHVIGLHAGGIGGVSLGIESLGVRHAAGHPQDDQRIGG